MEALKAGDRPAYEAANKLANEAFSKSFFMQLTLSATFFWPVFFALGWMQYRFLEIEFPIPGTGLVPGLHRGVHSDLYSGLPDFKAATLDLPVQGVARSVGHQVPGSGIYLTPG